MDVCRKVKISLGSSEKKFLKSEKILHNILIENLYLVKQFKKSKNKFEKY